MFSTNAGFPENEVLTQAKPFSKMWLKSLSLLMLSCDLIFRQFMCFKHMKRPLEVSGSPLHQVDQKHLLIFFV